MYTKKNRWKCKKNFEDYWNFCSSTKWVKIAINLWKITKNIETWLKLQKIVKKTSKIGKKFEKIEHEM